MELRVALLMLAVTSGLALPTLFGANLHKYVRCAGHSLTRAAAWRTSQMASTRCGRSRFSSPSPSAVQASRHSPCLAARPPTFHALKASPPRRGVVSKSCSVIALRRRCPRPELRYIRPVCTCASTCHENGDAEPSTVRRGALYGSAGVASDTLARLASTTEVPWDGAVEALRVGIGGR